MRRSISVIGALAAACLSATAMAQGDGFIVRDFRVEGAQRIAAGTVYNYLPINLGDRVDQQRVRESVRALYSTGFFQDVELRRDGDVLVIAVLERPSIQEFTFTGNEDIKTEDLERSLSEVGLAQGKTFDRSVLEEVTQFLTEQYYSRGKYAARITPTVEPLEDNRVRVSIEIEEGQRAKIRQINIVGNTAFTNDEILANFELSTGGLLSFIRDNNSYSKEALEGDLETLRSFYMDRGYADFRWDDVQVQISPDKKDIFITIGLTEGDLYTISDVRLAGRTIVPEEELRRYILAQPGQIFSQGMLAQSEQLMSTRLGIDGYAFAQIRAVPELDRQSKEVNVTFFVDPQNRVYVRRINFNGADSVNDEVFRREMRQLEGGYLSNALVERSKLFLQRLPYIESVDHQTTPVQASPDQVDVDFAITEGLPGQFGGSLGFSEAFGITLGGNFIHSNFMGTGRRVALDLRGGEFQKVYSLQFTDPYRTVNNVARTVSFTYQDITQFTSVTSAFSTTTLSAGLNWGYPISDFQTLRFGFSYQDAELITSAFSSQQAREWVQQNGNPFQVSDSVVGTGVRSLELSVGYSYNSLNAFLFPTAGTRFEAMLNAAAPGSEVEYYVASLGFQKYVRMPGAWRFRVNSNVAFGDAFGETTALPPFRNFFGGGPNSVRGFRESTLGPVDSLQNPNGGNMLVTNQLELIIPTPEKLSGSTRIALFYDIGGVFSTGGVNFYDKLGAPTDYDFDYDRLKRSVGLGVEWLAPLGLLRFSYAVPLNQNEATDRFFGDNVERFQFSIGNAF